MELVCLDMEGVLTPEVWLKVAEETGIEGLRKTTRDEPDYDVLMKGRLDLLAQHHVTIGDIQKTIATMDLLEGAKDFIAELRTHKQVVVLSDTFTQFAGRFQELMDYPTLFCNWLDIDDRGIIIDYHLRQKDGKRKAVQAFHSMGVEVVAAGDSYNDLTMILEADRGAFFRPPQSICDENPQIPAFDEYEPFLEFLLGTTN